MMPFILDAVKAYATLQEITDVLRQRLWSLSRAGNCVV